MTPQIQKLFEREDVSLLMKGDVVQVENMGLMRCHCTNPDAMLFIGLFDNELIRFITIDRNRIIPKNGLISFKTPYEAVAYGKDLDQKFYYEMYDMLRRDGIAK